MGIYTPQWLQGIKAPNFKTDAPQRLERVAPRDGAGRSHRGHIGAGHAWRDRSKTERVAPSGGASAPNSRQKHIIKCNLERVAPSLGATAPNSRHSSIFWAWWRGSLQTLERPLQGLDLHAFASKLLLCFDDGFFMPSFAFLGLSNHHGMSLLLGIDSATPKKGSDNISKQPIKPSKGAKLPKRGKNTPKTRENTSLRREWLLRLKTKEKWPKIANKRLNGTK